MSTLLSVITINYNGLEDTSELIRCIPVNDDRIEVIVVDNASRNDEASELERRFPEVTVVRSTENKGFAGGNNLGIQASQGAYLFFINNDTLIPCFDDIFTLIGHLEDEQTTGIVCPKIKFAWEPQPMQFAGFTPLSRITVRNRAIGFGETDNGQYDQPATTPYAHGAAMLVRRQTLEDVGLMPETFFLYYEEIDWSLSFRKKGYAVRYDPCMTILHKESRSTGQHSPLKSYYLTRNRLLLVRRNWPAHLRPLTYLYLTVVVGLRDILLHTLHGEGAQRRATLAGIADFLRHRTGRLTHPLS